MAQGREFEIYLVVGRHSCGVCGYKMAWKAWPSPEFEGLLRPTDWNDVLFKVLLILDLSLIASHRVGR